MNFETILGQLALSVASQAVQSNQFWDFLRESCHHSAEQACSDILDAVQGGHISPTAAKAAINTILDDLATRDRRRTVDVAAQRLPLEQVPLDQLVQAVLNGLK